MVELSNNITKGRAMPKVKLSPREICQEVGVDHLEWVEVMRRIRDSVIDDDVEVITKTVGTFYKSKHRTTTKTLNGIVYQVPAKVVVALRGPRFPGEDEPIDHFKSLNWNLNNRVSFQENVELPSGLEFEVFFQATSRINRDGGGIDERVHNIKLEVRPTDRINSNGSDAVVEQRLTVSVSENEDEQTIFIDTPSPGVVVGQGIAVTDWFLWSEAFDSNQIANVNVGTIRLTWVFRQLT